MRTTLLLFVLATTSALAAEPAATATQRTDLRAESSVAFLSVPQLAHLALDGHLALSNRIIADLGGWNVFRTDHPEVLKRGGWLGTRIKLIETDAILFEGGFRAIGYQPEEDASFQGGLGIVAATTIKTTDWLEVRPEFELSWLGGVWTSRAANELRFRIGNWRIDAVGGAQAWVRDGGVIVAPALSVLGGYRATFDTFDLDLGAGIAASKDASFLTGHPMQLKPSAELQPWAFVRFALIPRL